MARKKTTRKKKSKKGIYLWLFLLFVFTLSIIAFFYIVFLRPGTITPKPSLTSPEPPTDSPIIFEETAPPHHRVLSAGPVKIRPAQQQKARLAIVIDDMGFKNKVASQLLALDSNLSFAFLPHGPHTVAHLALAKQHGRDILLHLPMEPQSSQWNPGKGALLTAMNGTEIANIFNQNLAAVPHVIGVNNHMGSRFSEDKTAMRACLKVVKQHNLFFLDSLTARNSIAYRTAKEMGIKTGKRDIFLDNEQTAKAIQKQLYALIAIAKKNGSAIGIGHPYQATLDVLRKNQRRLQNEVKLVGVSHLME